MWRRGFLLASPGVPLALAGCRTREERHAAALTVSASVIEQRSRQTRRFETLDETALLQAAVGVLLDLGFTIDESRPSAGLIMGSKSRDAVEAGQVAAQVLLVLLAAALGSQHRAVMDRDQRIRVLLVVRPAADGRSTTARATFQRIVFNTDGAVSRTETIDDPEVYQAFFDQLAQSSFLTAHGI